MVVEIQVNGKILLHQQQLPYTHVGIIAMTPLFMVLIGLGLGRCRVGLEIGMVISMPLDL